MGPGFGALLEFALRARERRPCSRPARRRRRGCSRRRPRASCSTRRTTCGGCATRATRGRRRSACAQEFRADLPPGARLVYGRRRGDRRPRHPVAHNASTWFAWLDRHGATYAAGAASLELLDDYARRDCWFWIAKEQELADPAYSAPPSTRATASSRRAAARIVSTSVVAGR
jgi:hypothetical protein